MITIKDNIKFFNAPDNSYHYSFNMNNGYFKRWGKSYNDNPTYSPFGPEILDLEITSGYCPQNCNFCYKSNNQSNQLQNMDFTLFKSIFHKMPNTLTQIAFGITTLSANPDFFNMMNYSKQHGIVPNFTMTGSDITTQYANQIAATAGSVAISVHQNKDVAYNAVNMLTNLNMNQINLHLVLSNQTLHSVNQILNDIKINPKLKKLNAIVFLSLKQKGQAIINNHQPISNTEFNNIINLCKKLNINYGMDSCSAKKLSNNQLNNIYIEPCESSLFSAYINCKGDFTPCSFAEHITNPLNINNYNNFLQIWNHPLTINWRNNLIKNNRNCPLYNI